MPCGLPLSLACDYYLCDVLQAITTGGILILINNYPHSTLLFLSWHLDITHLVHLQAFICACMYLNGLISCLQHLQCALFDI